GTCCAGPRHARWGESPGLFAVSGGLTRRLMGFPRPRNRSTTEVLFLRFQLTQVWPFASPPLTRHRQRGGRSRTDTVTVVIRLRLTTTSQIAARAPPYASASSLSVPTGWRRRVLPCRIGASLVASR